MLSRTQLIIVGGVGVFIIILILLFTGILPGLKTGGLTKYELSVWGLKRDEAAMKEIIGRYSQINSNVTIKYLGIPEQDYEEILIDNLAAGTGPDIILLRNDWFRKHRNKILPAPADAITPTDVANLFPEVVGSDFVYEDQVYGLPLSIDTLALAYNRSIFDLKQIPVPPTTWDGIKAIIPRLRELTAGNLTKGAIAAGSTDETILNARDILTALMMQAGGFVYNQASNEIRFANPNGQKGYLLYTEFADPNKSSYAWNNSLGNSVDAFANGNVAMTFLYSSQLSLVRAKNPLINMVVLPLPQLSQGAPVNIASYWALAVSNRTFNYPQAWNFIKFVTTDPATTSAYVNSSQMPPALRSLIGSYPQGSSIRVFVSQILTAKSWPVPDSKRVSAIFNDMIKSYSADLSIVDRTLRASEEAINRLIK